MNLPLLHRRPPVIHGPIAVPVLPDKALVETLDRYATAHDADLGATTTRCGLALWPFWTIDTCRVDVMWRLQPHWCDACWPGHRCVICGVPSGQANECARCLTDSIDADKRIERAA